MVAKSFLSLIALLPFVLAQNYVVLESRQQLPQQWKHFNTVSPSQAENFVIPMRVGLTQNNIHKVEDILMDVSDPDSVNYGNHLSAAQIVDTFAPSQDRIDRVRAWIAGSGIAHEHIKLSLNKGWLEFSPTIAQAEELLRTKYHVYEHAAGHKHLACENYSVPAAIQDDVDLITPTLHFDAAPEQYAKFATEEAKLNKRFLPVGQGPSRPVGLGARPAVTYPENPTTNTTICGDTITPACIEALYDFNPYEIYAQAQHDCKKSCDDKPSKKHHKRWGHKKEPKKPSKPSKHPKTCKPKMDPNAFAIVEYTPNYMNYNDNAQFFSVYAPKATNFQPTFLSVDGAVNNQTNPGGDVNTYFGMFGEGNLDFQYAGVLAYPAIPRIEYFQVGVQNDFNNSFNNLLDAIDRSYCTKDGGDDPAFDDITPLNQCGRYAPPKVLSTSYGYNELDLTPRYERRQCNEYAKLGMAGTSFFFSSGDNGVAGNLGQCTTSTTFDPTYAEYTNGSYGLFNPAFPSTCPYITSVGATKIPAGTGIGTPEVVAQDYITSGGGVSNVFARPSYQQKAVDHYFATNTRLPSVKGVAPYNTSNSRAFPDMSANGLNYTVFYENSTFKVGGTSASAPVVATIFSLINFQRAQKGKKSVGFINPTLYKNPGALNDIVEGSNPGCGTEGFYAQAGWDPATGLGTPCFGKLSNVFNKLK